MLINFRRYFRWYLLGGVILATIFVWWVVYRESADRYLTVSFLDVGQGDAILIEAPNGNQLLIDGGPNKKVLQELARVMPFYDRSIDLLLVTHPDRDHIGGSVFALERLKIGGYIESGNRSDTLTYQSLRQKVVEEKLTPVIARRGLKIFLDQSTRLEVLFPDRDAANFNSNDASVVIMLYYGETRFLLTGDAPQKIEEYLVALDGDRLNAEVLKVGHHGSKTSTGEIFLAAVRPKFAVIQAAENNPYGHPHRAVTDLLAAAGARILENAKRGTITLTSDGRTITVKK